MKRIFAILVFTVSSSLSTAADTPSFIKVGSAYVFVFAKPDSKSLVASVIKDEGAGWLRVSSVEKREELWINLAQVQSVVRIEQDVNTLRAAMQKQTATLRNFELEKKILTNLRMIAAAVDQFRLEHGGDPGSLDELVGPTRTIYRIESIAGEDYRTLKLSGDGPFRVRTKDGLEVSYPRK